MACRTETTQIGENEYSVTQWPADKSILTKFKLTKVFGASLLLMIPDKSKNKSEKDELSGFSEGLSLLFKNNSPEELFTIMKSCIVGVARNGTKITETSFNEVFSGDDLIEIYKVFLFVLKVNYSNLFKGQLADRFLAKMKENL